MNKNNGLNGADGGTRTPTLFRITDFKSVASTDSATSAGDAIYGVFFAQQLRALGFSGGETRCQ